MKANIMTASPITLVLLSFLTLGQFLHAAPSAGYVVEWGYDTATGLAKPAKVVLSNATAISVGMFNWLALETNRTVTARGHNLFGQVLGYQTPESGPVAGVVAIDGRVLSNVAAIVAGRQFGLALRKDGTLVTWGQNHVPTGLTNAVAIAAAGYTSAAVRTDGTVVEWVSDPSRHQYGELSRAVGVSNAIAVALGQASIAPRKVALLRDGTVTSWGRQSVYRDADPPAGLSNLVAVTASGGHTLALKSDGTVVGWGYNKVGQATGTPTTNSPCISAGQVRIEGHNLTNIASVAAGEGYSLALTTDGRLIGWGRMVNDLYPVTVPRGLSNVVAIATGWDSCLAITTNSLVAERFQTSASK
jgi:alpha-tubulin suppressor-like RCC1 family protein